ncbi:hypothetical protein [Vreelandella sp. GE22]
MTLSIHSGITFSVESYKANALRPSETPSSAQSVPTQSNEKSAGIHVDLSPLGRALAAGPGESRASTEAKQKNIDESDFSIEIKEIMKRIVELQEELRKKQEELQAVMQDQSLSDEQRQQKANALQGEISQLSGALNDAMGALSDAIQQEGLEKEAALKAASLVA